MNPHLMLLVAKARRQELLDAAAKRRPHVPVAEPLWGPIVIRVATANDRTPLERLAALDSTERPTGTTLIAERLERPVAALSLSDGKVIADPFIATGDIVALLTLRAQQLGAPIRSGLLRRFLRPGNQ